MSKTAFDQQVGANSEAAEKAGLPGLLVQAALAENEAQLADLLGKPGAPDAARAFATAASLMRARIAPDARAKNTARIANELRAAATSEPPLLLAKFRWLHHQLAHGQDVAALIEDIKQYALGLRDAETLAVILHGAGRSPDAIALLSNMLGQAPEGRDRNAIGYTLAFMLAESGQTAAMQQLLGLLPPMPELLRQWLPPVQPIAGGPPVTTVVVTNIGAPRQHYQNIAPPSDALIRQTLESYKTQLQAPADWPVLIYYDMPKSGGENYRAKLEAVAKDYNAQLICMPHVGLRRVMLDALDRIETPYYFFLEHDWTFAQHAPPLPELLKQMVFNPQLNALRYNYNYNLMSRHDGALLPEGTLLETLYYCNHPGLVKTAKMKRDWLPLLADDKYDAHNNGAGGVEETIYNATLRLIEEGGLLGVVRAVGAAVTGKPGDMPRALHWGI